LQAYRPGIARQPLECQATALVYAFRRTCCSVIIEQHVLPLASIDELTPEDRRHVAALVESLRKRASSESADR